MDKPKLYFNNLLRDALKGDDGTEYATCAEGLEYEGEPYKVRGDFVLAADSSSIANLEGCGIKFDTTGNRYVITDSEAAFEAVGSALTLADNLTLGMVISGSYLYVGTLSTPAKIIRIDLATFTQSGSAITLGTGEGYAYDLASDGIYLYVACNVSPGKIARINLSSWQQDGTTVTLASGEDSPESLCVLGGYLYAACSISPGKIVRVQLSDFTQNGTTITLASGEYNPVYIEGSGSYIYTACATSPGKVVRIQTSDFTVSGTTVTFATGENTARSLAISGNYIYVGCGTDPAKICRINISTWLQDGTTVTLASGENTHYGSAVSEHYLFIGLGTNPSKIARIRLSDFTQNGTTVTFSTGEQMLRRMEYSNNSVYANLYLSPGMVRKVRDLATLTLSESLQTVDIGDSFSIRAGLSCAQQDASYPALLAADNSLSPVHKGSTNTAHYLRAHLPNLLTDGGFESGSLTGSWTTGSTNWVIESSTELEGAYSASYDVGATAYLRQSGTDQLEKGTTYRLIFKAKSVTANPTTGAITVNLFQTGSGTAIDSDAASTQPAITTSATWFAVDYTPDFTTDDWYLNIAGDSSKANGATEITMDEFYLYEKPTVNTLIIGRHNLVGKSGLVVKSYKMSPLRSTAGADDYTEIKASFTVDTADTYSTSLTASYDPIVELYIPATSSWAPEIGELYIGDYYQPSRYPQGPLDPYRTNSDGLRELTLQFKFLAPSLRTTTIERLFDTLRSNDSLWLQWDTDAPLLMYSPPGDREAQYDPYTISLSLRLIELP